MFDLIDWRLVVWGATWVTGAAVALAAVGFADYEAARLKARTRDLLRQPGYQAALRLGAALFAVGQAGLAANAWLAAAWLAVGAAFGWLTWKGYTSRHKP
jgi:hypothetical protein